MPGIKRFLKGFGLEEGRQFGDFILDQVNGREVPIVRDREYEYPISMIFIPQGDSRQCNPKTLLLTLKNLLGTPRMINSSYGNPYQCTVGRSQIDRVSNDCHITITTMGQSHRVYDD